MVRRDGIKASLKPSRANTKMCTSIFTFSLQGVWWYHVSSKRLQKLCHLVLLAATHLASLLGWLCSGPAAFLGRPSVFLASLTSCVLLYTLTSRSCVVLSGDACSDSSPAIHCLDSQASLGTLGGNYCGPTAPAFCLPGKPVSCGECQGLPTAE
jgi:hypothetical protein